jgi:multicomponent K+:H+ antiporter subunit E
VTRLLPHPLVSATLAAAWVGLQNSLAVGTILTGLALGLLIPLATRRFWPATPRVRRPLVMLDYARVVLEDIVKANLQVARLVVFVSNGELRPAFVTVPLDLRTPEAITALAATITMTPGTVSADLSADGRALLVHALDVADPAAMVAEIKERYERRLKEIFE